MVIPSRICTMKEHGTRLSQTFFGTVHTGTIEFARTWVILPEFEGMNVRNFPLKATVATVMGSFWENAKK